ncbi:hypothetical protein OsJ_34688 [Oryza sativa Japonica Group]|uniref:Uncharacterized protein n=1 Tax=Oryza sativa subsp. japonica TaxID=39947 RepID=A3CDJ0_ORYSJ|nr:hypothetical protein OsJ_34688 [Oryza sativa Japonica Group]
MAHLTNGAVDSLLGVLSKVVKDEAKLLGGVEGDIQFIRDEMDSMNGFLLHLTKSKTPHNDQLRAWMKQVRDVTYVADDCISLYMRDLIPPEAGLWPWLRHIPKRLRTIPARHRLANKIHKLKDRVREVGERRLRYDVKLPELHNSEESSSLLVARDGKVEEKRNEFLRAIDHVHHAPPSPSAIEMLPLDLGKDALEHLHDIKKCLDGGHVASMKMLLRALYAYPYGTIEELKDLSNSLKIKGADVAKLVMIFCYSKLPTHCKSCLQYLAAMGEEDKINRACLVRRWVAEGLLPLRVVEPPLTTTMEEAGELCFKELVFRGFLLPAPSPTDHPQDDDVAVGTCSLNLKSCVVDNAVKKFIPDISKSDNFVVDLPTHLQLQLKIRHMVRSTFPATASAEEKQQPQQQLNPMDGMVKLLKELPEEYRLNVIDLGGCQRLEKSHLKSICKVTSLKIGKKTETLRHVRIKDGQADLARIGSLEQLRKLGVVLDGSQGNITHLLEAISKRRDTLRSLSVWITEPPPPPAAEHMAGDDVFVTLDHSQEEILAPSKLESLDLNLKCFFKGGNGGDKRGYKLPTWINEKFQALSKITLRYTLLRDDGLRILGKLKSLRCLRLLRKSYIESEVTLEEGEFGELRLLLLDHVSDKTALLIKARAAPKLEKIVWNLNKTKTLVTISPDDIAGINNTAILRFKAADAAAPTKEKVDWNCNSTRKITPDIIRGSIEFNQVQEGAQEFLK